MIRQNHFAKLEQIKKNKLAAGLLRDRFPKVSGIVIQMTYYHGSHQTLMERTVNFCPSDYAYFNMACMTRGCENGGFDLSSVIRNLVKKGGKSAKGEICCEGHSPDLGEGHASIAYKVSISYAHKRSPGLKKSPQLTSF